MKKNDDIRKKIFEAGLKYWQVAEEIGISAGTLCVWLRQELSGERLKRVEEAIESLKEETI